MRNQKLKSVGAVKNVLAEQMPSELDEKRKSPRADSSRTHQNTNSGTLEEAFETYLELLPEKRRKNAVIGAMQLISTSEEFETEEEEEEFYKKAREFVEKNFGKIVGWSIHRDETSTHMQCVTIPLVDGKLNARKLFGGNKHKMEQLQTDFYNEVGKQFGLARGEPKAKTKAVHKTVEQKHREQEKALAEREKRLSEREKELDRQESLLNEKMARFEQDRAFDERAERVVQSMCEEGKFNENSKSRDLFGALRQVVKGFAKAQEKLNKLLKSPLDTVFNWVADAKARGCSDLFSYFQQKEQERKKQQQKERTEENKKSFSR